MPEAFNDLRNDGIYFFDGEDYDSDDGGDDELDTEILIFQIFPDHSRYSKAYQ